MEIIYKGNLNAKKEAIKKASRKCPICGEYRDFYEYITRGSMDGDGFGIKEIGVLHKQELVKNKNKNLFERLFGEKKYVTKTAYKYRCRTCGSEWISDWW